MATRGIEPITLPWKRPEKGVSAAELGASFRVEQREDGWHCTVRVGRRAEVLATGLRRLRDAQCRAEAHAATMPEVVTALAAAKAEAAKPAAKAEAAKAEASKPVAKIGRKGSGRATQAQATAPAPSPAEGMPPPTPRGALDFEQVSDGCICGKIEAGTWIADPTGKVSVPAGTDPDTAQEICRVAAKHYAAPRQKTVASDRSRPVARSASTRTAKQDVEPATKLKLGSTRKPAVADAAPVDPPRRAGKGKRNRKKARQRLAAKLAAKPGRRGAAAKTAEPESMPTAKGKAAVKATVKTTAKEAAKTAAKAVSKAVTKTATKVTATKATAKKAGTRATTKATATAKKATAKTTPRAEAKTTAKAAASVTAKTAGRRRKGTEVPVVAPPRMKEEPMGKKVGKGERCGCLTWAEVEGKARGEAKHGAFVIEPEGKKHALYFYDLEGQSRHLQSGEAGKLRKVAEEMAARGQPAMKATSAGDDGALLKMFMAGAMEEEA